MILPNQLTVARIVLTPVFLFFFLAEDPLYKQISLGIFIVAAITDWYDGWLARKFNYITNWGKFLDPLADKILTSTAFFAFVSLGMLEFWMVLLIVVRDFLITFLRLYADFKNLPFTTSKIAKWKTFIQMIFIYYMLLIYVLTTVEAIYIGNEEVFGLLLHPVGIYYVMLAITIVTALTGISYVYKNRKIFSGIINIET